MALLCTLHADGPATLKRLRQSGCTTLDALAALDAERVAAILACTPASARRLQREAESLRTRLTGNGLEREEHAGDPVEAPRRAPSGSSHPAHSFDDEPQVANSARGEIAPHDGTPPSGRPRAFSADLEMPSAALPRPAIHQRSAADPGESVPVSGAGLEARDKRLVQRVLETWRARDVEEGANAPRDQLATPIEAAAHVDEPIELPVGELASGTPLHVGLVDSLDAELCAQLCAAGVLTLEDLASRDAVELARAVPAGFSRLVRLISLARRGASQRATLARGHAASRSTALPFTASAPSGSPATMVPSAVLARGAGLPPKISWSELPPVFEARGVALELPEALKTTPASLPKNRPARTTETGREGAGGPFA